MERKFYDSDFEDLIKDKADQYKMYPSDKVWKNINRSLRSRKKWYWSAFVVLLSGISYLSLNELMKPALPHSIASAPRPAAASKAAVNPKQLLPFTDAMAPAPQAPAEESVVSNLTLEDSGTITASFDIPLQVVDPATPGRRRPALGSLRIEGLEPLATNEVYSIELSFPPLEAQPFTSPALTHKTPAMQQMAPGARNAVAPSIPSGTLAKLGRLAGKTFRHISWQLAFSPTTNYRKLSGGSALRSDPASPPVPLGFRIQGDVNSYVHHSPALGFELGTHAFVPISNRFTLKAGLQFNYSKYDIQAYRSSRELATISLLPSAGRNLNSLSSYTDLRNFGGYSVDNIHNQYVQLSMPVGVEMKVLGNDRLQFNIAGTLQPTYRLNKSSYLITNDYKDYMRAPSLVRRWNMNVGAEAYLSYNRGPVKWQVGPQFRYQLFSSYDKAYPVKEYLTEVGIKIGITKTIR